MYFIDRGEYIDAGRVEGERAGGQGKDKQQIGDYQLLGARLHCAWLSEI